MCFLTCFFSAITSYPIIFYLFAVRNLENFKCNAERKPKMLAVYSRELSLFGIAGFPGPRTRNNEVRGFFMRVSEALEGHAKEPEKNLTA